MSALPPITERIREDLRSPFVPQAIRKLAEADGYLEVVWPLVASSVQTAGFLGSARYMADMALASVEEVYEPVLTRDSLLEAGVTATDLDRITEVVDVFHYVQPQLLLVLAALAEAMEREQVGGYGKADPRELIEREQRHLATPVQTAASLPPDILEALNLAEPPDLYSAVAAWPGYLQVVWEELQHLVAYPEFRRRGRGLYFYARAGARFLAEPLRANPEALREAGLTDEAIEVAQQALAAALPATAMMMMHAEAMRLTLGIHDREVVQV